MAVSQSELDPTRRSATSLAILLGLALVLSGALLPLIPQQFRPMNFAVFGAVGLFVGSRAGRWAPFWALGLMLGGKLLADLLNYLVVQPGDADYLPAVSVYLCYAFYPVFGWLLLTQSGSFLRMFGTTALAGLPFFFITNTLAWKAQALPYPLTFSGLMEAFLMGLPFHWGTLMSDLAFSGLLFAGHTELARLSTQNVIPIEVRS